MTKTIAIIRVPFIVENKQLLNNGRHMTLSRSPVIPACFWRESRKIALDNRLRGYDQKTLMQGLVPRASRLDLCPHLLRSCEKMYNCPRRLHK